MTKKLPENIPLESWEQEQVIKFRDSYCGFLPGLELLYHIPNGGKRHATEGSKLRKAGVLAGMPDLHLPIARCEYNSLYIEMKRLKGGVLAPNQKRRIKMLQAENNLVVVCRGHKSAMELLTAYLTDDVRKK